MQKVYSKDRNDNFCITTNTNAGSVQLNVVVMQKVGKIIRKGMIVVSTGENRSPVTQK